jgi:Fe-S cluster assembly iron-binding protein IscA
MQRDGCADGALRVKMIGGGFKIHNPNATQTCSCGENFAV